MRWKKWMNVQAQMTSSRRYGFDNVSATRHIRPKSYILSEIDAAARALGRTGSFPLHGLVARLAVH
jgi:hypothetical protein